MDYPIRINGVWKTFGRNAAVRGLSLNVPAGSVYAFLGPNGAGKSTTIRMMLGLQRPDRGGIFLFGRPLERERDALLRRTGSLVEAPSLYLHLTGRENLEVHRRLLGIAKSAIDEALDTVHLMPVAGRLARHYSSGMKQRLGIAQALLGNPSLLLLDEPTNGLDPAGMQEVRALVRDMPKRLGATVFLSSHLLAEVEQVATHLAIVSQGQLKFEGTPEQLQNTSKQVIVIKADPMERAMAVLREAGCAVGSDGGRLVVSRDSGHEGSQINAMLVQAGIAVSHLVKQHMTLEDLFLELTESTSGEEHAYQ